MSERTRNHACKNQSAFFGEFASEEGKEVTGRSVQACDTFEINHNETRFASDSPMSLTTTSAELKESSPVTHIRISVSPRSLSSAYSAAVRTLFEVTSVPE